MDDVSSNPLGLAKAADATNDKDFTVGATASHRSAVGSGPSRLTQCRAATAGQLQKRSEDWGEDGAPAEDWLNGPFPSRPADFRRGAEDFVWEIRTIASRRAISPSTRARSAMRVSIYLSKRSIVRIRKQIYGQYIFKGPVLSSTQLVSVRGARWGKP